MIYPLSEQIELALSQAYDPETGELTIPEEEMFQRINQIQMDYEMKLDGIVCEIKNLTADAEAIKAEEDRLAERRKRCESRRDRLKRLMAWLLQGEQWQNSRHKITYRKSSVVVLDDDFVKWAEENAPGLLKQKEPEPRKTEIAAALKAGFFVEHAHMETKTNIQIK